MPEAEEMKGVHGKFEKFFAPERSMPDEREKFDLGEMIGHFDLQRVSLGGPVFDVEKLAWLNGLWLRELSDESFLNALMEWSFNRDYVMQVLPHLRSRVETLSQVAERGLVFYIYRY